MLVSYMPFSLKISRRVFRGILKRVLPKYRPKPFVRCKYFVGNGSLPSSILGSMLRGVSADSRISSAILDPHVPRTCRLPFAQCRGSDSQAGHVSPCLLITGLLVRFQRGACPCVLSVSNAVPPKLKASALSLKVV